MIDSDETHIMAMKNRLDVLNVKSDMSAHSMTNAMLDGSTDTCTSCS